MKTESVGQILLQRVSIAQQGLAYTRPRERREQLLMAAFFVLGLKEGCFSSFRTLIWILSISCALLEVHQSILRIESLDPAEQGGLSQSKPLTSPSEIVHGC